MTIRQRNRIFIRALFIITAIFSLNCGANISINITLDEINRQIPPRVLTDIYTQLEISFSLDTEGDCIGLSCSPLYSSSDTYMEIEVLETPKSAEVDYFSSQNNAIGVDETNLVYSTESVFFKVNKPGAYKLNVNLIAKVTYSTSGVEYEDYNFTHATKEHSTIIEFIAEENQDTTFVKVDEVSFSDNYSHSSSNFFIEDEPVKTEIFLSSTQEDEIIEMSTEKYFADDNSMIVPTITIGDTKYKLPYMFFSTTLQNISSMDGVTMEEKSIKYIGAFFTDDINNDGLDEIYFQPAVSYDCSACSYLFVPNYTGQLIL